MTTKKRTEIDIEEVTRACKEFEAQVVIPHCVSCKHPCCKLEQVVLELDWKRAQALYQIGLPRREFNRTLKDGTGPAHIKEAAGIYYAHQKPCPAYDDVSKKCNVYNSWEKPDNCSDFPVYEDGDVVTTDQRCEAMDLDALEAHLKKTFGDVVVEREPDPRFPVIVSLRVWR
jgi:Fe-S-cluster containining protein